MKQMPVNNRNLYFRPYYVETVTPTPKDLVLVLDRSESMKTFNIMNLAKEAAKTVIGTLNPNDRVSNTPELEIPAST